MWKQVVTGAFVLVIGFALLLGAIAKFGNVFVRQEASQSEEVEVLPLPPPTISRETTFLTEPIDEYGYIDYLAALNQFAKAAINVDENSEVLFAQAGIGLSEFSRSQREEFCRLIGLETTSASRTEFIPRTVSMDEDPTLKRALAAPWKATELPEVVAWLESNSAALELVVQGTKRSKCYVPLLPDETSNSGATLVNVLVTVHQGGAGGYSMSGCSSHAAIGRISGLARNRRLNCLSPIGMVDGTNAISHLWSRRL